MFYGKSTVKEVFWLIVGYKGVKNAKKPLPKEEQLELVLEHF
jgi:hypothetical protein